MTNLLRNTDVPVMLFRKLEHLRVPNVFNARGHERVATTAVREQETLVIWSGRPHNTLAIVYTGLLKYLDSWKPGSDILKEQWNLLFAVSPTDLSSNSAALCFADDK